MLLINSNGKRSDRRGHAYLVYETSFIRLRPNWGYFLHPAPNGGRLSKYSEHHPSTVVYHEGPVATGRWRRGYGRYISVSSVTLMSSLLWVVISPGCIAREGDQPLLPSPCRKPSGCPCWGQVLHDLDILDVITEVIGTPYLVCHDVDRRI